MKLEQIAYTIGYQDTRSKATGVFSITEEQAQALRLVWQAVLVVASFVLWLNGIVTEVVASFGDVAAAWRDTRLAVRGLVTLVTVIVIAISWGVR